MYIEMYIFSMNKRYSMAEARKNLPGILDDAEAGAVVEITRRGKPVAIVTSPSRLKHAAQDDVSFAEAVRKFREERNLDEDGFDPEYFRSLRSQETGRKVKL